MNLCGMIKELNQTAMAMPLNNKEYLIKTLIDKFKEMTGITPIYTEEQLHLNGYYCKSIILNQEKLGSLYINEEYKTDEIEALLDVFASIMAFRLFISNIYNNIISEKVKNLNDSLSFSERFSIKHILKEVLNSGSDGKIIVASKIADENGVTRSVIVNGLRKLEAASVIFTKSLGMKGTLVQITNMSAINMLMK